MSTSESKQQNTLASIYAVSFVLTAASFMPFASIQAIASIMFLGVLIALYVYRARAEDGDLLHNHCVFLIRTIWIASLLFLLGIVLFGFLGDHFVVTQMSEDILNSGAVPTEDDMHLLATQYLKDNVAMLTLSFAPGIVYFLYRLAKGAARAIKGYRIQNPKGWF